MDDTSRALARIARLARATITYSFSTHRLLKRTPPVRRPRVQAARQQQGCRILCGILSLHVHAAEEDVPDEPHLIVSNHFGILDPIALASVFPAALVGKAEIEKWPILGRVARTMGVIFVNRGRAPRVRRLVSQVRARLDEGVSVIVFPEGTTSPGPQPKPFKAGAFESVARTGRRVLPAYLHVASVGDKPADSAARARVVWTDSVVPFLRRLINLLSIPSIQMQVYVGTAIEARERDRRELAQASWAAVDALQRQAESDVVRSYDGGGDSG